MFEFTEIAQYAISILGALFLSVLTFAANRLGDKLGLERDSQIRELVNDAIHNAINFAIQRLHERSERYTIETEKEILADIVNYVVNSIPEALTHFGITQERLVEMVEARLYHYEYEDKND